MPTLYALLYIPKTTLPLAKGNE